MGRVSVKCWLCFCTYVVHLAVAIVIFFEGVVQHEPGCGEEVRTPLLPEGSSVLCHAFILLFRPVSRSHDFSIQLAERHARGDDRTVGRLFCCFLGPGRLDF